MATRSLWGELPEAKTLRTPAAILREQATILGRETDGVLEGVVGGHRTPRGFVSSLSIHASAIDYSVQVVELSHGLDIYPLRLANSLTGEGFEAADEPELMEHLASILGSEKVRSVVGSLLNFVNASD